MNENGNTLTLSLFQPGCRTVFPANFSISVMQDYKLAMPTETAFLCGQTLWFPVLSVTLPGYLADSLMMQAWVNSHASEICIHKVASSFNYLYNYRYLVADIRREEQ